MDEETKNTDKPVGPTPDHDEMTSEQVEAQLHKPSPEVLAVAAVIADEFAQTAVSDMEGTDATPEEILGAMGEMRKALEGLLVDVSRGNIVAIAVGCEVKTPSGKAAMSGKQAIVGGVGIEGTIAMAKQLSEMSGTLKFELKKIMLRELLDTTDKLDGKSSLTVHRKQD